MNRRRNRVMGEARRAAQRAREEEALARRNTRPRESLLNGNTRSSALPTADEQLLGSNEGD